MSVKVRRPSPNFDGSFARGDFAAGDPDCLCFRSSSFGRNGGAQPEPDGRLDHHSVDQRRPFSERRRVPLSNRQARRCHPGVHATGSRAASGARVCGRDARLSSEEGSGCRRCGREQGERTRSKQRGDESCPGRDLLSPRQARGSRGGIHCGDQQRREQRACVSGPGSDFSNYFLLRARSG